MFSSAEPEYRSYPLATDSSPFALSPRGGLVRRIGKRPAFLAYATNYLLPVAAGINYCHSIPFEAMTNTIIMAVNQTWGNRTFANTMVWVLNCQTKLLLIASQFNMYPPPTDSNLADQVKDCNIYTFALYQSIYPAPLPPPLQNMIQPIDTSSVLLYAKKVASHHFSALTNLRLGNGRWNAGLQDSFDPTDWFYWSGTELRFANNLATPYAVGAGIAVPVGLPAPIGRGFYYHNPRDCIQINYASSIGYSLCFRAANYTDPATNVTCPVLYSSSNAAPFISGLLIGQLPIRYYLNPLTGGWTAF